MAFHPYPQLIPQVFNPGGFGPPRGLTRASTWPWVDHSASGLEHATTIALFGLAFATATPHGLTSPRTTNSQAHSSKGTQSPRTRRCIRLSRLVGTRFQVLFHSPPGVLFTFPSRYLSAIGHQGVFRLSGWSRQIHTEFHGLGATWETRPGDAAFSCTGLSPSTATPSRGLPLTTAFSHSPPPRQKELNGPTTPTTQRLPAITCNRFSLIRFRSPLLTESRLFSLPVGTEMFHFPTFPPHALCVQARVTPHDWCGVPPFGNPRINARLTAPRGLSQPPTSFIGSWCQGIHRVPLTTWPHKKPHTPTPGRKRLCGPTQTLHIQSQKMLASTVQFSTNDQTPPTRPRQTRPPPQGARRYEIQDRP